MKADRSIYSEKCQWEAVSRYQNDTRRLLSQATVCPLLAEYNIEHVGYFRAYYPYEIFRIKQSGTFVLACTKGKGEVSVDGTWREVKAGEACIFPPHITNSFRAVEEGDDADQEYPWEFTWVRYTEPEEKKVIANTPSPKIVSYRAETLQSSVFGLIDELHHEQAEKVVTSWVNLTHQQVQKLAVEQKLDDRLAAMLKKVLRNLSHDWTLYELAHSVNLSEEHLRRLSNAQLGRSPMQHITFLRLTYAKNLVIRTDKTIEMISMEVGYRSQFSFSNAFLKWIGCRPSELR